jgi:hypothetical protein
MIYRPAITKYIKLMFGIILFAFSCIPREDPPDRILVLSQIETLPVALSENSGMSATDELIWFINDSGNEPRLYGYNRNSNMVVRSVVVKDMQNRDWEDITQNETYIFIGDFGNNNGSRNDLRIIMVNKSDLNAATDTVIPFGNIEYHYEDQTDFTPASENTPFDCEAFIATDEKIILFTKDWVNLKTSIYEVPATPGNYAAEFQQQWNIDGLITSAAWSEQDEELYLLGYTPVVPFLWIYKGFDPTDLSVSSGDRTDFIDFLGSQTEGMTIMSDGSILISSETNINQAGLFAVTEQY